MTPKQIAERLTELQGLLVDKIEEQPFTDMSIFIGQNGLAQITIARAYRKDDYELGTVTGGTFEEVLAKAQKFIHDIPSLETRNLQAYQRDVAKLIDTGRKNGIPDKYVNLLADIMKDLSENIITDQTGADQ